MKILTELKLDMSKLFHASNEQIYLFISQRYIPFQKFIKLDKKLQLAKLDEL